MPKMKDPTHPYIETIKPYEPPDLEMLAARAGLRVEQLIRLDSNENPFGPSPQAVKALAGYPDYGFYPNYQRLRRAVADYAGVAPSQVVLGNGADEIIDMVIRLLVEPGQAVVTCPPTFSMYRISAEVNRCRVLAIPRRADLSMDVTAIEEAVHASAGDARLLFLASPGNPNGQTVPLDVIQRLVELPLVVAVDEAYIEFGGKSAAQLLPDHENLIVIRTFSKWAGLAGLRLGYALLAPRLAGYLGRIQSPYSVNAAAMVAALATLSDLDTVQANIARLIAERERLREALATIPWLEPIPTQTNFVLCRVKGRTGQEVVDALAQRGILIRGFSNPAMSGYIRITVGRPEQNEALLTALQGLGNDQ